MSTIKIDEIASICFTISYEMVRWPLDGIQIYERHKYLMYFELYNGDDWDERDERDRRTVIKKLCV